MLGLRAVSRWMLPLIGLMLWLGVAQAFAQEETEEEKQERLYREDYERYQKMAALPDLLKRSDLLLAFVKERPNSKMMQYAQDNTLRVLDTLLKQENSTAVLSISERFIKMRPKVGETYYFYGAALKNSNKFDDAMDALAKCYVLKNPLSTRAKDALERMYKARNPGADTVGSASGIQRIIKKAQDEVSK
jgi:tetratricopeptide (TPR) repeat protein